MTLRKGEIATTLTMLTLGLMFLGTLIGARTAVISRLNSLTPRAQTSCPFNTRVTVYQDNRNDSSIITFDETFGDSWKVINDKQQEETKFKRASGDKADLLLAFDTINPLYNPGDLASVRLRGPNDDDWDIVGVFCDNKSTTTNGCPDDIATQNQSPQRLIQKFKVDCGVDIHYGWVLHNLKSGSPRPPATTTSTPGSSTITPMSGGVTTTPGAGTTITPTTDPKPVTCSCDGSVGGERYCSTGCVSTRLDGWCTTKSDCKLGGTAPKPPEKPGSPIKKPTATPTPTPTPAVKPPKTEGPKGDPTLCSPKIVAKNALTDQSMDFTGPIRVAFIPAGFKTDKDVYFRTWITRLLTTLDSTNLGVSKKLFSFVYHRDYSRTNVTGAQVQQSIADCNAAFAFVIVNNDSETGIVTNFIHPNAPFKTKPYTKLTLKTLKVGPHIFPREFGMMLGLWHEFLPSGRSVKMQRGDKDDTAKYSDLVQTALDEGALGYPDSLSTKINCYTSVEVARDGNASKFKKNCTLPELYSLNVRNVMSSRGTAFTDACVTGLRSDNGILDNEAAGVKACAKSGGLTYTPEQMMYMAKMGEVYLNKLPKAPKPTPKVNPFNAYDLNGDGKVTSLDVVRCLQGGIECSASSILFNLGSSR